MCVGVGFLVKGRETFKLQEPCPVSRVSRCRLLDEGCQIMPGVVVEEWDAGEGEPEVAQVAWNSWQM